MMTTRLRDTDIKPRHIPKAGEVFSTITRKSITSSTPAGVKMKRGSPFLCTRRAWHVIYAEDLNGHKREFRKGKFYFRPTYMSQPQFEYIQKEPESNDE